jgi:hypothetical protein
MNRGVRKWGFLVSLTVQASVLSISKTSLQIWKYLFLFQLSTCVMRLFEETCIRSVCERINWLKRVTEWIAYGERDCLNWILRCRNPHNALIAFCFRAVFRSSFYKDTVNSSNTPLCSGHSSICAGRICVLLNGTEYCAMKTKRLHLWRKKKS